MIIACPHCGPRPLDEFYIRSDAAKVRPDTTEPDSLDAWHDYVHLRDNVKGPIEEFWQHAGGCRAWLVVHRDSLTHEVYGVRTARAATGARR